MLRAILACALVFSFTGVATSHADETREADQARATKLNEVGTAAFNAGEYAEALRLFKMARALHDRSGIVFNVAQTASKLNLCEEALEAYSAFVSAGSGGEAETEHAITQVGELIEECGPKEEPAVAPAVAPAVLLESNEPPSVHTSFESRGDIGVGFYSWTGFPDSGESLGSPSFLGRASLRIKRLRHVRLAIDGHFLIPIDDAGRSWVAFGPSVTSTRRYGLPFVGVGFGAGVAGEGGPLGYGEALIGFPLAREVSVVARAIGASPSSAAQSISIGVDLTVVL